MLTTSLFFALAAATAQANYNAAVHPGALAAKRDLLARQSSSDDPLLAATSCLDDLLSIYSSVPTPPPEILSWEESATFTDPCSITVPASLKSAFSSYESVVVGWLSEHSSELDSALSECPQYSSLGGASGNTPDVCTDGGAAGGGSGPTTEDRTTSTKAGGATRTTKSESTAQATGAATGSGTGSGTGTGASAAATSSKANAGPKETGFVAGAMAVAGILGVVAAL